MQTRARDPYPDALRAGALLVVVLGHWLATLPRVDAGRLVGTDHLLATWASAGLLTWLVQVVPLFVFVSAAVSADGVARRQATGGQWAWWSGRALALARPTVTYLAVLTTLAAVALVAGGRLLALFDQSLTIHLWFLLMLLGVQALLPWSLRLDARFGLRAVVALVLLATLCDLVRAGVGAPQDLRQLGARLMAQPPGVGWANLLLVWLLPQQLGIAWRRGRFRGAGAGGGFLLLGAAWLPLALATGYPVAMVGVTLAGNNMLPPTLALVGVIWLQVGVVLLLEGPARRLLAAGAPARAIAVLGAIGMPLYLWHKLAELPAAWLGERLGLPIDAGEPGEPGFWLGRACWIGLCALVVAPLIALVARFETGRAREVPAATGRARIVAGGVALTAGLAAALVLGVRPGAIAGLLAVGLASWCLRQARPHRTAGQGERAAMLESRAPGGDHSMDELQARPLSIGTPGTPWGDAEKAQWRASLRKVRSHAEDVVTVVDRLRERFDVDAYGELEVAPQRFPLLAVRSREWDAARPLAVVTGGVHGYETSGIEGALQFLDRHAHDYAGRCDLLVVPCVSPWAYERIQRWNAAALDPNRAFRDGSPVAESAALVRLLAPLRGRVLVHVDLHETTDSDESEFRPRLAARDGVTFAPGSIPDGFYLVDDSEHPQPAFQAAIIEAVARVTHIAPADADGCLIGSPVVAPGVIRYPVEALGLCAGITGARYVTTTEVYPDSARATPAQCNDAQVAAIRAALDHALAHRDG